MSGWADCEALSRLRSSSGSTRAATIRSPRNAGLDWLARLSQVKVIEINRKRKRLILSERAALRQVREAQKEQLLEKLRVGEVRTGRVSSLTDFGAFVDLGGADGLIHLSELSWNRSAKPRDILKVGQEVEVYILNVDREKKRIALSRKRLEPEPWTTVDEPLLCGTTG